MKKRNVRGSASISKVVPSPSTASDSDLEKKGKEIELVKYEALPEYLKDNEYIRNYYRCEWPLKNVLLSVFSLHNETLNIWTHLLGFMMFTWMMMMSLNWEMSFDNVVATLFGEESGMMCYLTFKSINQTNGSATFFTDSYGTRSETPNDASALHNNISQSQTRHYSNNNNNNNNNPIIIIIPQWPWLVFLLGATTCLIFSASSHLFACHSRRFHYFFWRLDYVGISLMIVTSFSAPTYYAFLENPAWRHLYLSSITIVGIFVIITLIAPTLSGRHFRVFRAALFLCMGLSGIVPATHAMVLHWEHPRIMAALCYEVAMGVLYGVGAFFYVTRIPERWRPGGFDIIGHSHQIFHVFVVAAALTHSVATLTVMEWRRGGILAA